jgi:hypothetical protein
MAAQYQYVHGGISISIRRKPSTGEMALSALAAMAAAAYRGVAAMAA